MLIFRLAGGSVSGGPEGPQGQTHFYRKNLAKITLLLITAFTAMQLLLAPYDSAGQAERVWPGDKKVEHAGKMAVEKKKRIQRRSFVTDAMENNYQRWRCVEFMRPRRLIIKLPAPSIRMQTGHA